MEMLKKGGQEAPWSYHVYVVGVVVLDMCQWINLICSDQRMGFSSDIGPEGHQVWGRWRWRWRWKWKWIVSSNSPLDSQLQFPMTCLFALCILAHCKRTLCFGGLKESTLFQLIHAHALMVPIFLCLLMPMHSWFHIHTHKPIHAHTHTPSHTTHTQTLSHTHAGTHAQYAETIAPHW